MDCSLPGSSIHGSLQATVLECVAISFPKEGKENNHINEMIPKSKELGQEEEKVVRKGVEPDTITFWGTTFLEHHLCPKSLTKVIISHLILTTSMAAC